MIIINYYYKSWPFNPFLNFVVGDFENRQIKYWKKFAIFKFDALNSYLLKTDDLFAKFKHRIQFASIWKQNVGPLGQLGMPARG